MRGEDQKQGAMFSYVSPQKRVPEDHPLRGIRAMVDTILKEMSRVSPGCIPRWGGHRLRYNIGLVVAGFLAFACYVGVVAWGDSIGAIPNAEINFFTTAFQAGWLSIYDGGGEHLLFSRSSF